MEEMNWKNSCVLTLLLKDVVAGNDRQVNASVIKDALKKGFSLVNRYCDEEDFNIVNCMVTLSEEKSSASLTVMDEGEKVINDKSFDSWSQKAIAQLSSENEVADRISFHLTVKSRMAHNIIAKALEYGFSRFLAEEPGSVVAAS